MNHIERVLLTLTNFVKTFKIPDDEYMFLELQMISFTVQ